MSTARGTTAPPMASGLDAQIRRHFGSFELDVAIRIDAGETVALLGPNGAGKVNDHFIAQRAIRPLTGHPDRPRGPDPRRT